MVTMSRHRSPLSAVVASFAVVAALAVPCPCPLEPAATEGHGCCTPPAGVRAADPCCDASGADAQGALAALSQAPASAPAAPAVGHLVAPTAVHLAGLAGFRPVPASSPPPTVRRL